MITIRLKQIYVKINENIICLLNPQFRALESGNSAQGIQNPANDWNPKSSIWNPESTACNPDFKSTVLDYLTLGD